MKDYPRTKINGDCCSASKNQLMGVGSLTVASRFTGMRERRGRNIIYSSFSVLPLCRLFDFRSLDIFLFSAMRKALHEQEGAVHEAQEGQEAQQCFYNQLNQ